MARPKPKKPKGIPGTNRICPECGGVMNRQLQCGRCGHGK